jgi:hypothetical protein
VETCVACQSIWPVNWQGGTKLISNIRWNVPTIQTVPKYAVKWPMK